MNHHRWSYVLGTLLTAVFLTLTLFTLLHPTAQANQTPPATTSTRLIISLSAPPLAGQNTPQRRLALTAEQNLFLTAVSRLAPEAELAYYVNEHDQRLPLRYDTLLNGVVLRLPAATLTSTEAALRQLPQVTAVSRDRLISPTIFAAVPYVNAPDLWQNPAVGGQANAGAGTKFATLDWGLHPDAPMFDGTGYSYPPGYPLGDTTHTNGKIIVARAYFRDTDPPVADDAETWPGASGDSHGLHTGSTAVGNPTSNGLGTNLSGIAPAAYALSYKVFYRALSGQSGFNTAEGIAALEDMVNDGTDVVNNSWGNFATSVGGIYDPLDTALRQAQAAGVMVIMSAGNDGQPASVHHPSADYLVVGASENNYGRLSAIAPAPVSPTLQNMPFAIHAFGQPLALNQVYTYAIRADVVISPSNIGGCLPWPTDAFSGTAALIYAAGTPSCQYADKVYLAEQAGAELVVIYYDKERPISNWFCTSTAVCDPNGAHPTIPSLRVSQADGQALLGHAITFSNTAVVSLTYRHTPDDLVAWFSSRGPALNQQLKPDLIAPGDAIYAQGYDFYNASGEDIHLGYGMATGTSMAAPQVAGGALLLRQIHPDWSQQDIQSALMTTAKFRHVYLPDGSPAQPLDMGAGRLDLSRSADPGVLVWPPRLSFGFVPSGSMASLTITVRSVAETPQTYALGWLDTRGGFPGQTTLPGFVVAPENLALGVGDTAVVTVTFASTQTNLGDQQGYLLLTSDNHEAHLPAWARVLPPAQANPPADVLLIDNDGSTRYGKTDYVNIYTQTLSNLGLSYTLLDADTALANGASDTLDEIELASYPAIVYFSGDNNALDSFPIADRYRLNEFAAHGGTLLVTGQDARRTLFGIGAVHWLGGGVRDFVYWFTLAAPYQATSLTDNQLVPTLIITPSGRVPFTRTVELGTAGDGAGNQRSVDVLQAYTQPDAATLWHGPLTTQGVGTVHRQQATLEQAGVTWDGRVVYFSFGLEGVNNDTGHATREALLGLVWQWGTDSPTAVLQTTAITSQTIQFTAVVSDSATDITQYRWDMGGGTPIFTTTTAVVSHTYSLCSPSGYTARVEVQNVWGNTAVAGQSGLAACVIVEPTPTPTVTPSPTPSPTPTATPSPTSTPTPTGTPPPPLVYRVLLPAVVR